MNAGQIFRRTRIAPTPSGYLHLGNVLSFAITASLAKEKNARIFLRIDDMDRERTEARYVQDIFDTLNYLEIPWDEGPRDYEEFQREYSQVHRQGLYREALTALQRSGRVFACTCSRSDIARLSPDGVYPGTCRTARIPLDTDNTNWRLLTDPAPLPASVKDFVIRRKDGFFAYQLTSVVDDLFFDVDLVVRGEDLRASTEAQLYLSQFLPANTFRDTTFFHHQLLPDTDGEKLSKSAGALSVQSLRREGKTPADIYSMIACMLGSGERINNYRELGYIAQLPVGFKSGS